MASKAFVSLCWHVSLGHQSVLRLSGSEAIKGHYNKEGKKQKLNCLLTLCPIKLLAIARSRPLSPCSHAQPRVAVGCKLLFSTTSIIFTLCYGLWFFWVPRDAFKSEKYSVAVKNNYILERKSDLSELKLIIRKAKMKGVKRWDLKMNLLLCLGAY